MPREPVTEEEIAKADETLRRLDTLMILSDGISEGGFNARVRFKALDAIAQLVQDILAAIKPLGDPKASALLAEVVNLTQRMRAQADLSRLSGQGLTLSFATLINYLDARGVQCPGYTEVGLRNLPEIMTLWNGATSEDDIDTIIGKVTQYLSTLYTT